ncbi:GspE/PulE family protein [Macromonas nakdongensis]|uniref:GspE/PulE family protein n=1 Tax=Macromonas nakdongensis TaxID=1843082 RepID=UPI001E563EAF|nr:GspE/PulE family protein [Macromonas nakdongensis]
MRKTHFLVPNTQREDVLEVGGKVLTCTAEGWNGNSIAGHLVDFDPEHRQLKIQPFGDARGLGLKFNQIKRLKVDTQSELDQDFGPSGFLGDAQPPLQSFVVHLRDGALYPGICHGHLKLPYGLWVFPKKSLDDDPYRVFIPKSGITRFELRRGADDMIADTDFSETLLGEAGEVSVEDLQAVAPSMVENLAQLKEALERQARLKPVPIGEALLGLGKITPTQLAQALKSQRQDKKGPLGQMLVSMGLVTSADLQTAFARKMGYPFVDLNKFPVDTAALRRVPVHMAMRLKVLPIVDLGSSLVVAMADPLQFKVIDELEFSTQRKVVPVVSTSAELPTKIGKAYREIGMGDLAAANAPTRPDATAPNPDAPAGAGMDALQLAVELTGEAKAEQDEDKPVEQSDNTLVKLINSMISEAFYQRASDIHIEPYPGREKVVIRFRIDGEMRPYLELPASYRNALIARIKIMCDLDISERRKPQDGKINFSKFGGLAIELRVATIPTANGLEDVVMRVLTSSEPLPLEALNLSPANLQAFEHIVGRPYGLFLCAGPTGSGKTTTLHSALKRINTPNRKIWTAEDPVEITQRGLRQIQVNPKIGWSFATALRSLLRADPDVIMVGEIRDQETAEIAIEASLTGHLVFSTLHTNSAAETIVRLIDLGVDPFSFADSLQGILAQRLVRRFCKVCVQTEVVSQERLDELLHDYQAQLPPTHPLQVPGALQAEWLARFGHEGVLHLKHATGCEQCGHTGYSGRVAIHELLSSSPELRHLVQNRARPQDLQSQAITEGMRTLRQDGIEKVLMGLTSLAEVRSSSNV